MSIDEDTEKALRYRAKAALRQRARALRSTIPHEAILERSKRLVSALAGLPELAAAKSVALFYPIEGRNEVDLRALDKALRERGARVAYPTIEPESRVMTFRFVDDIESMEEQGFGFREPPATAPEAESLDVIVVPALQIDATGHRIGYGAGYYDRTIPRFSPPAVAVGVAFDFQLIPEVPVTEGDVPVSIVVTERGVIYGSREEELHNAHVQGVR
jgi:5-formyltetrahydrofolate cyclo-ligase